MNCDRGFLTQRRPPLGNIFRTSIEEIRFAANSPLEGNGFELSVPGTKEPVFVAEGELRDRMG